MYSCACSETVKLDALKTFRLIIVLQILRCICSNRYILNVWSALRQYNTDHDYFFAFHSMFRNYCLLTSYYSNEFIYF